MIARGRTALPPAARSREQWHDPKQGHLAPDGNSLYVSSFTSTQIYHYDLGGALLETLPITNPGGNPLFMTVVSAVPEPGTVGLLALACGGLWALRHRRQQQAAAGREEPDEVL
jgi:hypothetical protein